MGQMGEEMDVTLETDKQLPPASMQMVVPMPEPEQYRGCELGQA